MPYYVGIYRGGLGRIYGTDIRARSYGAALSLARKRRLNESVVGLCLTPGRGLSPTCSQVLRSRKSTPLERIHALAFLGLLALSAGVVTPREFFDDDVGVLHQWIHLELHRANPEEPGPVPDRADLLAAVATIEREIPGYPYQPARRRR